MCALSERLMPGWRELAGFMLVLTLLLWADRHWGAALQQAVLPWVRTVFQMWGDTYRVEALGLRTVGADRVVEVSVSLARCVVMDGLAFCPGAHKGLAQASTLAGSVDLILILMCAGTLSWPSQRHQEYVWRIAALVPVTLLIWSVDLPLILLGAIWRLHHDAYVPGSWSLLLVWCDFIQGGGRFVLAGMGVCTVVAWGQRMSNSNLLKRYKLFILFQ